MMTVCKSAIPKLQTTTVLPGQSYYQLTRRFIMFLRMYNNQFYSLLGFLGGSHTNRDYKDDPNAKPNLVAVSDVDQRRVLSIISKGLFAPDAFSFIPTSIYQKLAPNPYVDFETAALPTYRWDQPMRDQLSSTQINVLKAITQPDVIGKIANNAFKQAPKPNVFNVVELIQYLDTSICSEIRANQNVTELRAMLQQAWFDRLIALSSREATALTADARIVCRAQLKQALHSLNLVKPEKLNTFTKMHIADSIDKINKALNSMKVE